MASQHHEARYLVGLDFGTTFTGFAYARRTHPDDVFEHHNWPEQPGPYCKTTTTLWYVKDSAGNWLAQAWGWPAVSGYLESLRRSGLARGGGQMADSEQSDYLLKRFKLLLSDDKALAVSDAHLPPGVTADKAIEDYLRKISQYILEEMRAKFGLHVQMADIEWALTVPAIWSARARQRMRNIAQAAGMTSQGSTALHIILEPEAAAMYCHLKQAIQMHQEDRILIFDAGGGTVDIVVHEVGEGGKVKEVARSDGGLCGSTFIDDSFLRLLGKRITVLIATIQADPAIMGKLLKQWDGIKRSFRGDGSAKVLELPPKLARAWINSGANVEEDYEIELSNNDMMVIFDPVVDEAMRLVESQLSAAGPCKAILAVGGFSESPYLIRRLRERFSNRVQNIVVPPNPGAAICHGALLQMLHPDTVSSRVSRKTYGVSISIPFIEGVHPESKRRARNNGQIQCTKTFKIFVANGEAIDINAERTEYLAPAEADQTFVTIDVYSTDSQTPTYVDETGVILEGTFTVHMPDISLGKARNVEVKMWFGRTTIEVSARGTNFGDGQWTTMVPFTFTG